jgi:hypothetical protein
MKSLVRLPFCNMPLVSGFSVKSSGTGITLKARDVVANLASTAGRTAWLLRGACILLVFLAWRLNLRRRRWPRCSWYL